MRARRFRQLLAESHHLFVGFCGFSEETKGEKLGECLLERRYGERLRTDFRLLRFRLDIGTPRFLYY